MSKTRKALHALVVLAFLTSLFALAIGEIVPNPDDFARKILDIRQSDASFDRSLKANPNQFGAQPDIDRTGYLAEGFEGGVVPPTNWTLTQFNPYATWEIDDYNPYAGVYNASCFYDDTYTSDQDEWLISPVMDFTAKSDLKLIFAWMGSYYWSVDPYNNCDLKVKITNDGSSWTTIFHEDNEGPFDSWTWYEKTIDLTPYELYDNAQIAFVYEGYDGAQFSIDAIDVNDDAAPIGRCCYDYDVDPQNPQCADNTALECDALGGTWDDALNCTEDPCPALGPNDLCTGAIAMADNDVIVGSTVGATVDCPGVLDWNAVWYSFENPYTCANVTMDYCDVPTVYDVECLGVVLYDECPEDCPNYILYTSNEWVSCPPAPSSQPITHFNMLPGPMTYYYPVFMGDGACDPIEADFSFRFLMVECPAAQDGDYCGLPIEVSIPGDLRGEYVDVNTTCGRLDYYGGMSTCLGYYDQGEDIIYEITVTTETCVDILVDPVQTYSGFALDDNCPPDLSCIVVATAGYSSTEYGVMGVDLAAGTYYLMIDTWPSPPCVDFTLTIKECEPVTPGNTCEDPITVKIPADIPYGDYGQKTCFRVNDYSSTCLGSYDGGEDAIYELDVTEQTAVIITMDPKSSTWSGLALDNNCPPASSCLAYVTGSSASPRVIEYVLDAGTYYIMVDTWPSPACIPDFDLTIDIGPEADITPLSFDFGTQDAGTSGSDILNIANVGGGFLNYDIEVTYTPPREIDGAYVEALGAYKPGMTMDIVFHAANASSDAEWIDEIVLYFPAECDVINSTDFDVVGATRYLEYEGQTGPGAAVVYWNWNGGYGNMYSTDDALATVTIAFDPEKADDITMMYTMSGDDWGGEPHDITGYLTIPVADPMTSWLVCTPTSGSVPGGSSDDVTAAWDATGLPNDTYDADINVSHNAKEVIPATITVINGMQKAKMAPDPAYIYYKYAFDPMDLTVYVGHFNSPNTAGDVTDLTVNGIAATIVGTTTHPSFTGDVVEATVPAADFLDPYGGPIGTVSKNFDVAGTVGGSAFTGKGKVSLHGKDAKTGGRTWMVPPDVVLFHGDVSLDGYIDIDDVVATIEFIFVGGQIFGPITIADVDCSHSVDIDDVVYLITYIFNNGAFPCHD